MGMDPWGWGQIPGMETNPWGGGRSLGWGTDPRCRRQHHAQQQTQDRGRAFFLGPPINRILHQAPWAPCAAPCLSFPTHQYNVSLSWHSVPPSLVARRETEFPRGFADVQGIERRVARASTSPRGPQGGAPAIRRWGNARFSHCAGPLPAAEEELLGPGELLKRLGVICLGRGKPKGVSRRGLSGVFGSPASPAHVPKAVWLPLPVSSDGSKLSQTF